jgi:hypothetical protein
VPRGGAVQRSGGEAPAPAHVNRAGMRPPERKAGLESRSPPLTAKIAATLATTARTPSLSLGPRTRDGRSRRGCRSGPGGSPGRSGLAPRGSRRGRGLHALGSRAASGACCSSRRSGRRGLARPRSPARRGLAGPDAPVAERAEATAAGNAGRVRPRQRRPSLAPVRACRRAACSADAVRLAPGALGRPDAPGSLARRDDAGPREPHARLDRRTRRRHRVRAHATRCRDRPFAARAPRPLRRPRTPPRPGRRRPARLADPDGPLAVTDKLDGATINPVYGCCILALSAHQTNVPSGWRGGDRIAIHAGPLGAVSAGCVHAGETDLRYLMRLVPLGTPVTIHA